MSLVHTPVVAPPEVCDVRNGFLRIAYQIVGSGPIDLVMVPGLVSHLGMIWEDPAHARFCWNLGSFARLILFDKRGIGLSDRDHGIADLDRRIDDMLAVFATADVRRPAIFGFSEGGKNGFDFRGGLSRAMPRSRSMAPSPAARRGIGRRVRSSHGSP